MWMRMKNEIKCLIKGHVYHKITNDKSVYQYCPRCGRITWQYSHVTDKHLKMDTMTVNGGVLRYRSLIY